VEEDDSEVVVSVAMEGEAGTTGRASFDLFLKAEQPAGWGPRQFDMRPRWNAATQDRALEVVMQPAQSTWRAGVWFAGVVGAHEPVKYTLTISKYDCPRNCSGHGTCMPSAADPRLKECRCEEGFGAKDCSLASTALEFGKTVTQEPAAFERTLFQLPVPTEAMLTGNVEVVVEASFASSHYPHTLEARPSVLLDQANGSVYPSPSDFTYKLALDEPNRPFNLSLCAAQVRAGQWVAAVYNPLPTAPLGFNLTVHKIGRCLRNCSDHGRWAAALLAGQ
jgi:hypothetical protein